MCIYKLLIPWKVPLWVTFQKSDFFAEKPILKQIRYFKKTKVENQKLEFQKVCVAFLFPLCNK